MPRAIRFHLDENCDPRIAAGLRLHGVDVTTTQESGLLHVPDDDQLAYARGENRVIVTQDTDFLRIVASGTEHPGVAFCKKGSRTIGQVITGSLLIWEVLEPDEMRNRVEYL